MFISSNSSSSAPVPVAEEGVVTQLPKVPQVDALNILVIPKADGGFWSNVYAGCNKAKNEINRNRQGLGTITLDWQAPESEEYPEIQKQFMDEFVTAHINGSRRIDGIILAPQNEKVLVKSVNKAVDAGIPVVLIDSGLIDQSRIVTIVATDNYQAGVIAAKQMYVELGGIGKVVLADFQKGAASTSKRAKGFRDQILKYPNSNYSRQ